MEGSVARGRFRAQIRVFRKMSPEHPQRPLWGPQRPLWAPQAAVGPTEAPVEATEASLSPGACFWPGKNAPAGQATCPTTGAGGVFGREKTPLRGIHLPNNKGWGGGDPPLKAKKCASRAGDAWAFDFARNDL